MKLTDMTKDQLQTRQSELEEALAAFKSAGLALDLTRGKPSAAQLDLSNDMDAILDGFFLLQDGTDVRNYGGITGIPEAREFGAALLGTAASEVLVGGNSSLTLMFNAVASMIDRWRDDQDTVRFLCPVPGYDRHFTICEHFNIEMVTVSLTDTGPDMDEVEKLIAEDPSIKGIWCVPKYSNPTGHTYSKETVERFAKLGSKAGKDFRIFWDNAYVVHHLSDKPDELHNLMDAAKANNQQDSVLIFASTSKVTFAGAGISFVATSEANLAAFEKYLSAQVIGFDKVNQLRHVRFLKDQQGLSKHMNKHKDILAPKFQLVLEKLRTLDGKDVANWTEPRGGYFVSVDTMPGLASKVVGLAGQAGVKLTPAGATFPHGRDPEDQNIRLAPSFPRLEEVEKAMDVFVICVELASVNHLLEPAAG